MGAIADYNKVIQLDPEMPNIFFNRGIAKGQLKQYAAALADYDKAIEQDSGNGDIYLNRGIVKVILKQAAGGCADLQKAAALGNVTAVLEMEKSCK